MNHKSINYESEQNTERVNEVHEAMPAYAVPRKRQGEYTFEDYYALPDDIRAELIDGELIFLESPSFVHQELIGELLFEIKLYIRANKPESILCYFFEESDKPHSYTFDDKIPVRIYDSNLVINFAEIKERLV